MVVDPVMSIAEYLGTLSQIFGNLSDPCSQCIPGMEESFVGNLYRGSPGFTTALNQQSTLGQFGDELEGRTCLCDRREFCTPASGNTAITHLNQLSKYYRQCSSCFWPKGLEGG